MWLRTQSYPKVVHIRGLTRFRLGSRFEEASSAQPRRQGTVADVSRLPSPVSDVWAWQQQGACRSAEPSTFFHPEGERGQARAARDAAAKVICATCPVISQCAAHALSVREAYGVWG